MPSTASTDSTRQPSDAEMFKLAFVRACLQQGVDDLEDMAAMANACKQAGIADAAIRTIGTLGRGVGDLGTTALGVGAGAAALAPWLAGGALGYGAAKLTDIDNTEIAAAKEEELIQEYQTQARLLRQMREMRRRQQQKPTPRLSRGGY